jgi:hypothetical protein
MYLIIELYIIITLDTVHRIRFLHTCYFQEMLPVCHQVTGGGGGGGEIYTALDYLEMLSSLSQYNV